MSFPRIEHVNVTVTDPERTARLMQALFDWKIRWQGPARDGGRSIHVGSDTHYIALYTGANAAYTEEDFSKGRPLNHIGVEVDDLDATEERVRRRAGAVQSRRLRTRPPLLFFRS